MHLEQTYLRYMMFVIETAIKNMKDGQEQWVWVLDLAGMQQRWGGAWWWWGVVPSRTAAARASVRA